MRKIIITFNIINKTKEFYMFIGPVPPQPPIVVVVERADESAP